MLRIPYTTRFRIYDFWKGLFKGTLLIQRKLRGHLRDQKKNWAKHYTHGYFYQGLEELGITGAKPTGFRFKQYQVDEILENAEVLDIGSNCGFVSIYCAKLAKSVTAIELNPYLNRIARDALAFFKLSNVDVIESDFTTYDSNKKFDVILSFSNHHTIDGNLDMGFEAYIQKCQGLLRPNGYLLFESHNVFGKGKGGVGDDGDMELKIQIMNKYFNIERYRMVRCFLGHRKGDIDKLFIVARQSDSPSPISFDLTQAREKYSY
ncbi:Methyltransferase domain-containing protein [Pseudidiomarina planktonica]|uniref:Methyltransferase domain-containing protein n=1 Tax=Pseudidiomarina planktonica TaxID=1323738 RepID=A0A1Y6EKL1_9GAMM|nr:methyltransferase domain-containing protein [Pseudidiomarina planktonica]RUO65964.1 methyltransferase domain-containing protein [Pseudidiomarina planktonica]SMQ61460.1 Methyltransferase domain-containing protein [Pseudidiomarina planktonica]